MGIRNEQCQIGFMGRNCYSCLRSAHLTKVVVIELFALASASMTLRAEASKEKLSSKNVQSWLVMGQSNTKWLKRTGEIMDS